MAANMQHMGAGGPMMQQQQMPKGGNQLQQFVYQHLANTPTPNVGWQTNLAIGDRMGKTMELISNIALAMNFDAGRAAEFACSFERDVFIKAHNKEDYDQRMTAKIVEFFKKRQANESNIQNTLNASAQTQQAMMNMQAQMGRGMGQPNFGAFQQPMQPNQLTPQQLQQQQQQQQQQFLQQQQQQQMAMNMANQAGRGGGPNPNSMGAPNRPQPMGNEMSRLGPAERQKVIDLASKLMAQATDQQKAGARMQLQQRLSPQQLSEMQAAGRDPLTWFFQNQAFQLLKNNSMGRFQQTPQQQPQPQGANQNPAAHAAMMQQQHSQQSMQRQNMMGNAQPNDFSQFTNMESIKDQQMNGLMAQQAGQMVVPASNRNATPQPGNPNNANQPQNQTPRPGQQQNQQQMKMNPAAQQMQQMQSQQSNMGQTQSPGMNAAGRGQNNMNAMSGQGGATFGDQRFNQGVARPQNHAFQAMLASMTPDQRQQLSAVPKDKIPDLMRRLQASQQMQMNQAAMAQAMGGNRPQPGQPQQQPQQPQQQQMQQQQQQQPQPGQRMPFQNQQQMQAMMDSMDIPPAVLSQMQQLPEAVKKWRDLKMWLSQNSGTVPPNMKAQLAGVQQKQFQMLMTRRATLQQNHQQQGQQQPGQVQPNQLPQQQTPASINPNMAASLATAGGPMPNQGPGNQQQQQQQAMNMNVPAHVLQITPQEMMQIRSQRPNLANIPDDQLRLMMMSMRRQQWMNQQMQQQQQSQRMRAQSTGQGQVLGPQPGQAQMPAAAGPSPATQAQGTPQQQQQQQQQQQNRAVQQQQQNAAQKPTGAVQDQNKTKPQAKNLKRPSPEDTTEPNAASNVPTARSNSTPSQPIRRPPQLTPEQVKSLTPEQRARYEQVLKMHMMSKDGQAQGAIADANANVTVNASVPTKETMERLKVIGREEQRNVSMEKMPVIPMTPQERSETGAKITKITQEIMRMGRPLTIWYAFTRDDARARMFFKTRFRLISQFSDGESMTTLKDALTISSSDIDQARTMLQSMARDVTASQQNSARAQNQNAQAANAASVAPLNAANLEKNSQAHNKMNQQPKAGKAANNQAPPAPTSTQPPVQIGVPSPHGNPNYMNKAKDMNLTLPPARKKQKTAQQGSGQAATTPSPQISKVPSPEVKRPIEPPKPAILCKEPDCDMATAGFASEQALQNHVEEEHTKPKKDPVGFVQENLALALGLTPDGSPKKDGKKVSETAPVMSATTSKQGQTPSNMPTPMSQDAAMKRSSSTMSRTQAIKGAGKADAKTGAGDVTSCAATTDAWVTSTMDSQKLLINLGFENGLPNIVNDALMLYRSGTPNDTPESSKDSGSSEPTSDISENAALEIDMNWQNIDTDLLLNLDNTTLGGGLAGAEATLDPTLLLDAGSAHAPDWNDINIDFSKPFQLDTSFYSMEAS